MIDFNQQKKSRCFELFKEKNTTMIDISFFTILRISSISSYAI